MLEGATDGTNAIGRRRVEGNHRSGFTQTVALIHGQPKLLGEFQEVRLGSTRGTVRREVDCYGLKTSLGHGKGQRRCRPHRELPAGAKQDIGESGGEVRKIQTGRLQFYALMLVVAVVIFAGALWIFT